MSMIDEKTRRFTASSLFPSLFLGAFGLVIAQAGVARMSGSWLQHALIGVPGIALTGHAIYRARLHWSTGAAALPWQEGGRGLSLTTRDFAWFVLLFATGIVVAFSARSILLLGIIASLIYMVPWTRVPVCRTRFIASSLITLAGAIAWLVLYGIPIPARFYLGAAWMVSIPPVFMMFMVLVSLPYEYRVRESAQVENLT
jgi:hypothetical protein